MECTEPTYVNSGYLKHGRPVTHINSRAQSCWSPINKKDDEHVPINQRRRPHIPCVDRVLAQRLPISKRMIILLRGSGDGILKAGAQQAAADPRKSRTCERASTLWNPEDRINVLPWCRPVGLAQYVQ